MILVLFQAHKEILGGRTKRDVWQHDISHFLVMTLRSQDEFMGSKPKNAQKLLIFPGEFKQSGKISRAPALWE